MSAFETAVAVGCGGGLKINQAAITYTRAGFAAVPMTAAQGKKLFKIQEPGKPVVIVQSVDFLIKVADLLINGTAAEPAVYDEITRVFGTKQRIFKVLPMGKGIPIFDYMDSGQTVYRIHTKYDRQEDI